MAEVHFLPLRHARRRLSYAELLPLAALVVVVGVLLGEVPRSAAAFDGATCTSNQFKCNDGSCILQAKMCDGRFDCKDKSDELDCDQRKCVGPQWFECNRPHGQCLSSDLVCNNVENCPGGEDELNCRGGAGVSGGRRNCTAFEYTCEKDKTCIPLDFICNGRTDCPDNSDEIAGCQRAKSTCRGFFCENRKCLESSKWVCDGVDDCGDGSDEVHCVSNCKPEWGKFLCRNNQLCLDLSKACDTKSDCPDGSDESARCTAADKNCAQKQCPPAAGCAMLPDVGPQCLCPKGYRLSELEGACVDINECNEKFGACSHTCTNTAGGYRCGCDDGYTLQADNRTCRAQGEGALLLYTTQLAVMGVQLRSRRVFPVAKNLSKVIGVAYDGDSVYWTNIQNEGESIVRSQGDGTHHEILLTSGLDAPEDLAVDWLTGNIYFSDNVLRHIAVCSSEGHHCAVLVTVDVHQPRGIALWPQRGQMYWTDWGARPMIARASMDGTDSLALVSENIHWPNGIAVDMHNDRLYWVDAKLATVTSVRSDGTDRRTVLDEVLKHPYGLAVFEDELFWSDWGTKSIHRCNKFTGKDHGVVAKDRTIYAVHVYHSAKQPRTAHACLAARCSHLCLLAANNRSSCACPDGMQLSLDQARCIRTQKKQRLYIGLKNSLLEMEHTNFGRHSIAQTHELPLYISELAYNNVNGTVFIADNLQRTIFEYDPSSKKVWPLVNRDLGNVTGIGFDHLAHNLYWSDSERHVVEVLSLQTRHRAIVSFFAGMEAPIALAIVPDDGVMFIALRSRRHVHIDQEPLSGQGEHVHVFEDEIGDGEIEFTPDYETQTLFWSDSDLGRISFSHYRTLQAETFRGRLRRPYSLAIVDDDLFWTELKSTAIHWTHRSNLGPLKRVDIEVAKDSFAHMLPARIPLLASRASVLVDHPCQHFNGGCSHVCVTLGKFAGMCLCPAGLVFKDSANRTCIEALDCEFRCRSGECLTQSHRCNSHKDCIDGSDEESCDSASIKRKKTICPVGQFVCHDGGQCVPSEKRCDGVKDCRDGSDEDHCKEFDKTKMCHRHQHACDNGVCVDFSAMCDGINDCGDNSDETNCDTAAKNGTSARPLCEKALFQCNSGTCIASSWECDGKLDCTDGSDEHEKCDLRECPRDMHKCLLGQCIDARLVCDDHNDCGDLSDEVNCDYATGLRQKDFCGQGMYQCPSNGSVCLELEAKCNGTAECPRGEDEADCGSMCSIYEFQCKQSQKCIRMEFRCDREKDCPDGSDENNCDHATNGTDPAPTHERVCEVGMFDCKDGQCVDMTRVCNGFADCDTEADEGPLCLTACKSSSGRAVCDHKCRPTPTGAVCSCHHGYRLDADQRSCVDVNECVEQEPCAQICENTRGSHRCSCYPDFMLRPDKTTCKSIESDSALLFTSFNEVRSMTEQPIVLRVAWSANDSRITGFDLNVRRRTAYFSADSEDILYMVDMASGAIRAGLSLQMPTKVAVDWITDNVYVISRGQRYEVRVCSFRAKMCSRVVQATAREIVKAVAVDAFNRKLFYVTVRSQSFGQPMSQISIANLDGTKRELLVNKNGGFVTAIATDPHKKLLYYADSHTKTLEAISYRVGGSRTPLRIIQKGNVLTHPSGLTVYENQAFIVNIGAKEARQCDLYGSRACKAFNLNILNAEDVVVDGASRQPLANDPCEMAKCGGMCVQAEFGYECMCGDAIVAEGVRCPKEASNAILSSALLSPEASTEAARPHFAAGVVVCLTLLAVVAAGVGYLFYRRVTQGHRDLNINLHFQNPLASSFGGKSPPLLSGCGAADVDVDAGTADTAALFRKERSENEYVLPIYRFLRGQRSNTGTEILLEASKPRSVCALEQPDRISDDVLVEDLSDDDSARTSGYRHSDDARTGLVP